MSADKSELLETEFVKALPEREALEELIALQKVGRIVIQPADKGFGIWVYDREDYVSEADRQLNDTMEDENGNKKNYYKKVTEKDIKEQFKEIKDTLEDGVQNKILPSNCYPPKLELVHFICCWKFTKIMKIFLKQSWKNVDTWETSFQNHCLFSGTKWTDKVVKFRNQWNFKLMTHDGIWGELWRHYFHTLSMYNSCIVT